MRQKGNGKNKDNNKTLGKMIKVNRKFAKASIRLSSSLNLMSISYVKSKGLTWKQLNNDKDLVVCIHDVEVNQKQEEPEIDENIIDADYVIKVNNSRRKSDIVDVRHISIDRSKTVEAGVKKNKCKIFNYCQKNKCKIFNYYQKSENKSDANEVSIIKYWYHHRIGYEKNEHKTFSHYQKSTKIVDVDGMSSAE
ncbi:hypothetical protein C2G38_2154577 [Gigaspora rosea]|uniref:Uncharacterized protein n=1 Tax=Gigaspora rosea TaxID=44941 RepID=A0A397WCE4_9GLOM|nr:hypothetical protein C2G38_2154577 [Gigaspora rosea]